MQSVGIYLQGYRATGLISVYLKIHKCLTMLVATNNPSILSAKNEVTFTWLGEDAEKVDMILLMLKRNFGAAHISMLRYLLAQVQKHPIDIPCYLIGCETTIPGTSIERYRHGERDRAIHGLLTEILRRSRAIGVRGQNTRRHLTKLVQIKDLEIDVIYDPTSKGNSDILASFLQRHSPRLLPWHDEILAFQENGHKQDFYERTFGFNKFIYIGSPCISTSTERDHARLQADISVDDRPPVKLWLQTDRANADYLTSEVADAFVAAILPMAMRSGKDIRCQAPVTGELLYKLNEVLIPALCSCDSRLHPTKVLAKCVENPHPNGPRKTAVATGMSCGVDSFHSAISASEDARGELTLTHLYCGNYLYGNESIIYNRAECAAKSMGLPLVITKTNLIKDIPMHTRHLYIHFYRTIFGILCLRKLFHAYYYSSNGEGSFGQVDLRNNSTRSTSSIELLLLYAFSTADFSLLPSGGSTHRIIKTKLIADSPAAQKYLNVCLHANLEKNCCQCEKCYRTLLMLEMHDCLRRFSSAFDLELYKNNRQRALTHLVKHKDTPMYAPLYKFFSQKSPGEISLAEAVTAANGSPAQG